MAKLARPLQGGRSTPAQGHPDVSRHPARKIDDLNPQFVPAVAEVPCPQVVNLFRHAGESLFPARLLLIDRTSAIGAEHIGKAEDLNFGQAVARRALDDRYGALNSLLVGDARGLGELLDQ